MNAEINRRHWLDFCLGCCIGVVLLTAFGFELRDTVLVGLCLATGNALGRWFA